MRKIILRSLLQLLSKNVRFSHMKQAVSSKDGCMMLLWLRVANRIIRSRRPLSPRMYLSQEPSKVESEPSVAHRLYLVSPVCQ